MSAGMKLAAFVLAAVQQDQATDPEVGLSAERIGNTVDKRMTGYEVSNAFAGPSLQDQLLLPMALAGGGAFTTVKISQHT